MIRRFTWMASLLVVMAATVMVALHVQGTAAQEKADEKSEFSRTTIDLGVVVSDVDKSVKFYTEALGFQEARGFSVAGPFCKDAGLTNNKPLKIRVLVLGKGPSATKLKLMTVADVKTKKSDNSYIHSQSGYSYVTVFVNDTNAAVKRLTKAGVKPIAKGPVQIPGSKAYLTVVRDPDGNLIELVGPKASGE